MEAKKINPVFDDLNNSSTIIEHLEQLTSKNGAVGHTEILNKLIQQFEPLDFELLAFPQSEKLRVQLEKLEQDEDSWGDGKHPKQRERKEIQKQLDKMKLNLKHYLILPIENTLLIAEKNRWGLCKNHDFIYLYNGAFWAEIDKGAFEKFLGEAAEQMGVEKFSSRYYNFKEQLFKQFLATAYLPKPETNKEMVLINLLNGTFEISSKGTKLRPFDRSDFIKYQLPFEYTPQAKAPLFESYLNKVLPDKERQRVLAEYLGYVFIKNGFEGLKLEKAMILYGTGQNGKSVFFDIVTSLFGRENISNYSLQSLTEEKGFYRAKIADKLVNYASEINGKLETSLFKAMVSGEPVEACLKYGQPFTMENYAKFIFNCNELPKDVEHTKAYFRRFLIVPFDVTIAEQEKDSELAKKIVEKELSGVFNWVLEGLNRLLQQKRFSDCEAAQQAVEQYKIESNSVQMFMNENDLKSSPNSYKLIKEIYTAYRYFCIEDGVTPFKKSNFIKQLRALGLIVDRVSQNQLAVFVEGNMMNY
jgi:putative DNA primase/helicase